MKKISILLFVSFFSIVLKSQPTCTDFNLAVDFLHYSVSPATHDSTFVKHVHFKLSDTTGVAKIQFSITKVGPNAVSNLQNYNMNTITGTQDLTVANACLRSQKTVKVSLGYFQYMGLAYQVTVKLYDSNNNLLSSSNFNFNH